MQVSPQSIVQTSAVQHNSTMKNMAIRLLKGNSGKNVPLLKKSESDKLQEDVPDDVKTSLQQISQGLTEQLKNTGKASQQPDMENMSIKDIRIEDTNGDGVFNAGDNFVMTISDGSGSDEEIKVSLTDDMLSFFQNESKAVNDANFLIRQAIIKMFIEQMKLQIITEGKMLREMVSESGPDFS